MKTVSPKLEEYKSLRDEIGRRSVLQHQVLHLYVIAVAGGLALIKSDLNTEMLLLALGLIGPIFGYWYFDQALGIETIGRYLAGDVEPSINRSITDVEDHLRWERGYRIPDRSIEAARKNLMLLQFLTFLGLTVCMIVLASYRFWPAAKEAFTDGEFKGSLIFIVYVVAAIYLVLSLSKTYGEWIYLFENRRKDLNAHAVLRLLESVITHGRGAAVTSFSPVTSQNARNSLRGQIGTTLSEEQTTKEARFIPETPVDRVWDQEKRLKLRRLALQCFQQGDTRMITHVDSTAESTPAWRLLRDYVWARLRLQSRTKRTKGGENQIVARITFRHVTGSSVGTELHCTGTFTVQNEEVIDMSPDTLDALCELFCLKDDPAQEGQTVSNPPMRDPVADTAL